MSNPAPLAPHQIRGQSCAKRAFEVAAASNLRIMLIGPLGSSKSTLRRAFPEVESAERESCACGRLNDVRRLCACSTVQLVRWYRRLERDCRNFDIVLEACPTSARDMLDSRPADGRESTLMEARIAAAREFAPSHNSVDLGDAGGAAARVMEMASRRLSLNFGQYQAILRTARAIANLQAKHVAEAVQYRFDATGVARTMDELGAKVQGARG